MQTHDDDYDDTVFRVPLDDLTVARLMELADVCHAPPAAVIAALVRDILEDDERENMLDRHQPEPVSLQ